MATPSGLEENVGRRFSANASFFSSGEVRAGLVLDKGVWIPYFVHFRPTEDGPSSSAGNLQFENAKLVKERLRMDEFGILLGKVCRGEAVRIAGTEFTFPLPKDVRFVQSDESWWYFRNEFATTYFYTPLNQNPLPNFESSSPSLPYYEDFREAVYDFFEIKGDSYYSINAQVFVSIPNLVAKIVGGRIADDVLSIELKWHKLAVHPLVLSVNSYDNVTNRWAFGKGIDAEPRNSRFKITLPDKSTQLKVVLRTQDGLVIDSCLASFTSSTPQKVTWPTAGRELEDIVKGGENETVEFKPRVKGRKDLSYAKNDFLETVSAFSNKKGGIVLLGVSDSKKIIGDNYDSEESLRDLIDRWILPRIDVGVDWTLRGSQTVLVVRIPEGHNKPYCMVDVSNGDNHFFYLRSHSSDRLMKRDDFDEIYRSRGGPGSPFGVSGLVP